MTVRELVAPNRAVRLSLVSEVLETATQLTSWHDLDSTATSYLNTLCRLALGLISVASSTIILHGHPQSRFEAGYPLADKEREYLDSLQTANRFENTNCAYFSAPIFIAPEVQVGTFYIVKPEVAELAAEQRQQFQDLANLTASYLQMQLSVRKSDEQATLYRLLADNSTDTIVRGNLEGVRLYISPSVRTLLGYEPEELVGRRAIEIVHPDHFEEFRELMEKVREGCIEVGVSEQRQRHKDGSWVWMEALIRLTRDSLTGEPDGYVASVRDISSRKEAERMMQYMVLHDPLTGLPNRLLFHQRLTQEIARVKRAGKGFVLLYLDLDRFKIVNDTMGHNAGDTVLCAAANRFRSAIRTEDTAARLGGDEFVIIQTVDSKLTTSAKSLANRLIEAMSEPIEVQGTPTSIGVSIGIVVVHDAGLEMEDLDADALLNAADQALYRAKELGRNTYAFFKKDII